MRFIRLGSSGLLYSCQSRSSIRSLSPGTSLLDMLLKVSGSFVDSSGTRCAISPPSWSLPCLYTLPILAQCTFAVRQNGELDSLVMISFGQDFDLLRSARFCALDLVMGSSLFRMSEAGLTL